MSTKQVPKSNVKHVEDPRPPRTNPYPSQPTHPPEPLRSPPEPSHTLPAHPADPSAVTTKNDPNYQHYVVFVDNLRPQLNNLAGSVAVLKRDFETLKLKTDGLSKSATPLSPADKPSIQAIADGVNSLLQQLNSLTVPVPPDPIRA